MSSCSPARHRQSPLRAHRGGCKQPEPGFWPSKQPRRQARRPSVGSHTGGNTQNLHAVGSRLPTPRRSSRPPTTYTTARDATTPRASDRNGSLNTRSDGTPDLVCATSAGVSLACTVTTRCAMAGFADSRLRRADLINMAAAPRRMGSQAGSPLCTTELRKHRVRWERSPLAIAERRSRRATPGALRRSSCPEARERSLMSARVATPATILKPPSGPATLVGAVMAGSKADCRPSGLHARSPRRTPTRELRFHEAAAGRCYRVQLSCGRSAVGASAGYEN